MQMQATPAAECAYCNRKYKPAQGRDDADILDEVMNHLHSCPNHPLRPLVIQRDILRAALLRMVGAHAEEALPGLRVALIQQVAETKTEAEAEQLDQLLEAVDALIVSADPWELPGWPPMI